VARGGGGAGEEVLDFFLGLGHGGMICEKRWRWDYAVGL
jgi:hypothetical protein